MYLEFLNFPKKFKIMDTHTDNIKHIIKFQKLNIKSLLDLSSWWGICPEDQRLFALLLMRQLPQFQLQKIGSIELNSNRLILYISGYKPIELLLIV